MSFSQLKDFVLPGKNRFLWLLVSLLLMLIVVPLLEQQAIRSRLYHAGLTAVFLSAILANWHRRKILIGAIVVGITAIILDWSSTFYVSTTLSVTSHITGILFLGFTALLLLISVIQDHMATHQAVLGAISVYLLMGLTWALMYGTAECVQEQPFNVPDYIRQTELREGFWVTDFSDLVYFSFVTMSTLGYGDITPRTPVARTMAWTQSVAGQLYLAVLVARLVTELPRRSRRRRTRKEDSTTTE